MRAISRALRHVRTRPLPLPAAAHPGPAPQGTAGAGNADEQDVAKLRQLLQTATEANQALSAANTDLRKQLTAARALAALRGAPRPAATTEQVADSAVDRSTPRSTSAPGEAALTRELRHSKDALRALQAQLSVLQHANEGAYRASYDRTGGPEFDPAQPFGTGKPRHGGARYTTEAM